MSYCLRELLTFPLRLFLCPEVEPVGVHRIRKWCIEVKLESSFLAKLGDTRAPTRVQVVKTVAPGVDGVISPWIQEERFSFQLYVECLVSSAVIGLLVEPPFADEAVRSHRIRDEVDVYQYPPRRRCSRRHGCSAVGHHIGRDACEQDAALHAMLTT